MTKILVVDDEKDVCEFTESFFKSRGFKVFCAANGEEALSIVNNDKPAIVLLDIRMKGMDGITVLKHMKEIAPSTEIIMVTAVDDVNKMEEASGLGARDYVTKPLVLEELERKVVNLAVELAKE